MNGYLKTIAGCGMWIHAATALYHAPQQSVTVTHKVNLAVRQEVDLPDLPVVNVAAIVPTEAGQIGINPPGAEPTPANIGKNTEYLTEENGSTIWRGSDSSHIAIATTTITRPGGETAVATITKGVSAHKNENGGLDIILSPAVKLKLEEIAKQVTPCAAKRRRHLRNSKRQGGPACGLADFVQRVGGDPELQNNFAEPLTDQVWSEVDSAIGIDDDPAWEGDGDPFPDDGDAGSNFSDDSGFFEGAEGAEGEATVETIVFSSEEEALAIGAALSGGEAAAAAAAVWGGSTVTAGSFLAWLWGTLKEGKPLAHAQQIPSESIHRVTKTKTESESETTTSTTSSCPTATDGLTVCGEGCKPTSVKNDAPEITGVVSWACSEGDTKDCACNPGYDEAATTDEPNVGLAIAEALGAIEESTPKEPVIECPGGLSNAPSEFFIKQTSKSFCEEVMGSLDSSHGPTAYSIKGDKIPILKNKLLQVTKRSPPENIDNYGDYRFFLSYEKKDGECLVDKEDLCRNAYENLAHSNCGTNHGSAGDRMFLEASIDVGCAKFAWQVDKALGSDPAPVISLGERDCHDPHSHYDVHEGQVDGWSGNGCRMLAEGKTMKPGDADIYWHPVGMAADYHQNYKISWIEGCDMATEQSAQFPVPGDESISCATIMSSNFYKCTRNGGAGAVIDAGCLRYDFYITGK